MLNYEGESLEIEGFLETVVEGNQIVLKAELPHANKPLKPTELVQVVTYKDSSGIVKLEGIIEKMSVYGKDAIIHVTLKSDAEQIQRRSFFRLPLYREISIEDPQNKTLDALTQNISAGGLRCLVPLNISPGSLIKVSVRLGSEVFVLKAEVLETLPSNLKRPQFVIRVAFIEIDEKDQSRLMSVIFSEQCKQKKKEIN